MQIIISQDKERFITITERCTFFDIIPLPVDEEKKISIYSLGLDGISFGTYKTKTKAKEVLGGLVDFILSNKDVFQMPADDD